MNTYANASGQMKKDSNLRLSSDAYRVKRHSGVHKKLCKVSEHAKHSSAQTLQHGKQAARINKCNCVLRCAIGSCFIGQTLEMNIVNLMKEISCHSHLRDIHTHAS
jgi:hypothetical protein